MEQFPGQSTNRKEKKRPKSLVGKIGALASAAATVGVIHTTSEGIKEARTPQSPSYTNEQNNLQHTAAEQLAQSPGNIILDQPNILQEPPTQIDPENSGLSQISDHRAETITSLDQIDGPLHLLDTMVALEAHRLGVEPKIFQQRMDNFFYMLVDIESDWNPNASNPQSSALSLTQHLTKDNTPGKQNGSVHTSINRVQAVLDRHGMEGLSLDHPTLSWAKNLYADPSLMVSTSAEEQNIMVFANIVQARGSDRFLKEIVSQDPRIARNAALQLYYTGHHTNPDAATINTAERDADRYFPLPNIEVASK